MIDAQRAQGKPLDLLPIKPKQLAILVLAVIIAALDGYDVTAMAFVAPQISKVWGIDKATLGFILSSSLMGMALGAFFLSGLADLFGRKPTVMSSLVLLIVGPTISALSGDVYQLAASRLTTGLGAGVMVAMTTSIAAEFSNQRYRGLAVAGTTVGFSVGAAIGGALAGMFLIGGQWQGVFWTSAAAAAVLIVAGAFLLRESPEFLIGRSGPDTAERLNAVLGWLGHPPLTELPPARPAQARSYRALFGPDTVGTTIRLASVFALLSLAAYFLISWLPQLIADLGFPPHTASSVSAMGNLAGSVAGLIFGALATFLPVRYFAGGSMICFGLGLALFGQVPASLPLVMLMSVLCGSFGAGSISTFYTAMAMSFTPLTRASGLGLVMGVGRVCSAIAPIAAGQMFAHGFGRRSVSASFALAAIAAGVLLIASSGRGRPAD